MAGMALTRAIIIGGAATVWDELARARELMPNAMIIGVNHAGRDYDGELAHWATMHPELFGRWIAERSKHRRPSAGKLWHAKHRISKVDSKPIESWGGSSGLLAVKLALDLGCERVILCGVPMEQQGCHYDQLGRKWLEARQYWANWNKHLPDMEGRVKSFSGFTMRLLGAPDHAWINHP